MNMKNNEQRINNVIGQLEGIKKMIADDKDCMQILVQMKAVKSALNSLTGKLVEENMSECLKNMKLGGRNKEKMRALVREIVKVG